MLTEIHSVMEEYITSLQIKYNGRKANNNNYNLCINHSYTKYKPN